MNTAKPNAVFSGNRQILTLTQYGSHDSGRYTCKVIALNKETIRRTFNLPPTLSKFLFNLYIRFNQNNPKECILICSCSVYN